MTVAELNIGDLFGDIDRLIAAASATADRLDKPREKALLSAVVDKLKLARKDAAEVIPAKLEQLKALAEGRAARAEQLRAEFERLDQEMKDRLAAAAKPAAAKPPAAPPLPPTPDADLGARLRKELLGRFAPAAGPEPPPFRPGKDIWEDWK